MAVIKSVNNSLLVVTDQPKRHNGISNRNVCAFCPFEMSLFQRCQLPIRSTIGHTLDIDTVTKKSYYIASYVKISKHKWKEIPIIPNWQRAIFLIITNKNDMRIWGTAKPRYFLIIIVRNETRLSVNPTNIWRFHIDCIDKSLYVTKPYCTHNRSQLIGFLCKPKELIVKFKSLTNKMQLKIFEPSINSPTILFFDERTLIRSAVQH